MNKSEYIPVLLLTGYLGSGKTTLVNHILRTHSGKRIAVIVNDIGEVNIDAEIISKEGLVQGSSDEMVTLQNGCICCNLQADLMNQLFSIAETGRFDYIVIEASGLSDPVSVARTIEAMPAMAQPGTPVPVLDAIVCVVDALRMASEFGCGDALKSHADDGQLEQLVIDQIEFCNILILNKISEVTKEQAAEIMAVVKALQPEAEIRVCDYADIDVKSLFDTELYDFNKVATSAAWVRHLEGWEDDEHSDEVEEHEHHHHEPHHEHEEHHHHEHDSHHHDHKCGCCNPDHPEHCHCHTDKYGINTVVYQNRRPFDFNKFDRMLAQRWPENIIRAKGVVYFSNNHDMSLLFEQAGPMKNLRECGLWYAAAPEEELKQLLAQMPALARAWDPVYGDRMNKIVVIGKHVHHHEIDELFNQCLAKE
ncbi:MAG: GTP-binding protein [Muribaculaceae bacterium]|nr:GTP-binding protein [Muribaculaceae bacterium]